MLLRSLLLILSLNYRNVVGHIPMRSIDWAEPDSVVYAVNSDKTTLTREQSLARLTALRSEMAARGVDAYIVPTGDAHNSQYIAPAHARREWLSGLSGSSGTALVTSEFALVWTDARYFTQFYMQVNTDHWALMRQGTDLSISAWLTGNLTTGSVVAVDPTTYTRSAWNSLQSALNSANITLEAISVNLVDLARVTVGDPAPAAPNNPIIALPIEFSGQRSIEKVTELLSRITARGSTALVITALDEVAWTLNLRGSDIPYNPVFFAYLVLRADIVSPNNVVLFWSNGTLSTEIDQHLISEGTAVDVRPYDEVFLYLRNMTEVVPEGSTIWLTEDASHAIFSAVENGGSVNTLSTASPVELIKCVKNPVELEGFRRAHIKDGTAVVRFLRWVHEQVDSGVNVTEIEVSDKLEELRAEEEDAMGPSFATIAGAGENGAVIHYRPTRDESRIITPEDMLLVDSGGQYRDGTTDITRTRHMSASPTPAQRRAFTRVLKGQINLGAAVFPRGIVGHTLETLARKALWDVGLNYGHGTGHGVGHFLNVHEGPSWILSGPVANDPGIVPGMIFSNEPGYYEVDEYGVRHEDLVEVIELNTTSEHIQAAGLVGDFHGVGALGFNTISLAPHQTACLDIDLLSDFEIKYLNEYHNKVFTTIGPILQQRNLSADYDWLERECAPIVRNAGDAIVAVKFAPLLPVIGVLSVWVGL